MQKILQLKCLPHHLVFQFDIDKSWDEKRQQWTISGEIYKTANVTQTAIGDKQGTLDYSFCCSSIASLMFCSKSFHVIN